MSDPMIQHAEILAELDKQIANSVTGHERAGLEGRRRILCRHPPVRCRICPGDQLHHHCAEHMMTRHPCADYADASAGLQIRERPAESPSGTFRRQLKVARRAAGLSQLALAERVGDLGGTLHETAITRIEKGSRTVTLDDVIVLAAALGVSPMDLVVPRSGHLPNVTAQDQPSLFPPAGDTREPAHTGTDGYEGRHDSG